MANNTADIQTRIACFTTRDRVTWLRYHQGLLNARKRSLLIIAKLPNVDTQHINEKPLEYLPDNSVKQEQNINIKYVLSRQPGRQHTQDDQRSNHKEENLDGFTLAYNVFLDSFFHTSIKTY